MNTMLLPWKFGQPALSLPEQYYRACLYDNGRYIARIAVLSDGYTVYDWWCQDIYITKDFAGMHYRECMDIIDNILLDRGYILLSQERANKLELLV